MQHPIQCQCGQFRAEVVGSGISNRVICYCPDCQAFARYFGNRESISDAQGGTEIVQVAQSCVRFIQGQEHLAVLKLSQTGMLRWYAACCNTPLGNTLASPKLAFIGLIHAALTREHMDRDFGAQIAKGYTDTALGEPKPLQKGMFGTLSRFFWLVLITWLSGRYRLSPFFNAQGKPIVCPTVLSSEALAELKGR